MSACDVCFIIFLYRPASTPHIYSFIHTTLLNRCIRLRKSRRTSHVRYHRRRSGRFFFMVHHHPSTTSTRAPSSPRTRPTHIDDTYDVYTTLGPPPNSLRRSPKAYRCNKYQEKPCYVIATTLSLHRMSSINHNYTPFFKIALSSLLLHSARLWIRMSTWFNCRPNAKRREVALIISFHLLLLLLPVIITPLPTQVN